MNVVHQFTHRAALAGGTIGQSLCGRARVISKVATVDAGAETTCKICLAKLEAHSQKEARRKDEPCPQFLSSRTFLPAAAPPPHR